MLDSQVCLSEFSSLCSIEYLYSSLLDEGIGIPCATILKREGWEHLGREQDQNLRHTVGGSVDLSSLIPCIFFSSPILSFHVLLLLFKATSWNGSGGKEKNAHVKVLRGQEDSLLPPITLHSYSSGSCGEKVRENIATDDRPGFKSSLQCLIIM